MKKIYILRHCKSSWDNIGLSDIDRPLNSRGKKDAPLMAEVMKRMEFIPDVVILSPSVRTRKTVRPVIDIFGIPEDKVFIEKALYHGDTDDFESIIQSLDDGFEAVLLVGHNPGITFLANHCQGERIDNVPTGGLLVIDAEISAWEDFEFAKAILKGMYIPRMFK